MPHAPIDSELAAYIAPRLAHMGNYAAEPGFIAQLIEQHRDLWVMLFRVDHDLDALELDGPRSANPL